MWFKIGILQSTGYIAISEYYEFKQSMNILYSNNFIKKHK